MSDNLYSVVDLPPARFEQAHPLVRASGFDMTLDEWVQYAMGLHDRLDYSASVLGAICDNWYIHALATYEVHGPCANERIISIGYFCHLELLNRSAGPLLISELERRARRHKCVAVSLRTSPLIMRPATVRIPTAETFQRLGYLLQTDQLTKRI